MTSEKSHFLSGSSTWISTRIWAWMGVDESKVSSANLIPVDFHVCFSNSPRSQFPPKAWFPKLFHTSLPLFPIVHSLCNWRHYPHLTSLLTTMEILLPNSLHQGQYQARFEREWKVGDFGMEVGWRADKLHLRVPGVDQRQKHAGSWRKESTTHLRSHPDFPSRNACWN